MKKLFTIFATFAMLCAVGCEEQGGGNEGTDIPDDAYISINKEVLTFSPDGESIEVKVYSNYEWTLTNNCNWVTTSISGGEASDAGVVVTLTADLTYDDREGTITFSCGKAKKLLVVSQSFKEAIIADENNVFIVPAEGGNVIINYQTTVECEVIIPEEAKSWISLAPATRALVSESATLTVAENTTYSERSAVVKVVKVGDNTLFAEYTIYQEQNDAIIIPNGENTFAVKGWKTKITIKYDTNVECEVIIPEDAHEWLSVATDATRALVRESVTISVAENNTGTERSAVVQVVATNDQELIAEYTITQAHSYFIQYTSTDGNVVTPYSSSAFGAEILSNTYKNGVGIIEFDDPITSIGKDAFYDCKKLESITIPDSVTSIGIIAFVSCNSLNAFYGKFASPDNRCLIVDGELKSFAPSGLSKYTIPNSVTSIG
ncbi:MAG: leucine-rich repeat protein, partial [Tidjanibacter sp.]|nr:leucine-rich repeat protein [Tidjanibacter sp.]